MKIKKWSGNPILWPKKGSYWEGVQVRNPAAVYEEGKVFLLYTACGETEFEQKIYLGLAISEDGFHFERVSEEPVFAPSEDGFDAGSVEDPRAVKIGDTFYITYAARAFPPVAFWRGKRRKNIPNDAPTWKENFRRSGLLSSKDMRHFKRLGPITSERFFDPDVVLFPGKIRGRYVMLHRPTNYFASYQEAEKKPMEKRPSIWLAYSDDLIHWVNDHLLLHPTFDWESNRVGAAGPPIRTNEGWLTLYHGVDKEYIYRVGVMLLDLEDPRRIIARSPNFIMEPEAEFEKKGTVNNVVFPCGNVVIGKELFIYYGGADTVCCVATVALEDLLEYVLRYRITK